MILFSTRRVRCATAALAATGVLTGCSTLSGGSDEPSRTDQVTAAFYPLAYASERVVGDHFTVINLTQPGKESHDLELSVKATSDVAEAAVVVIVSGYQPAVDAAVEQNAKGAVVDAASVVDLHALDPDHADGAHADDDHGGDHEGHDHGELDPHFWLDPLRMADFTDAIAAQMSDVDSDHADEYAANAATFRAELEALDAAYAERLAACTRDTVVVNHLAFGYLERYGLHFESITGLSPGAEPTIADRARLQDLIADEGVTTVFSEELGSTKAASTLAHDAGVTTEVLDPIEGLGDRTADEDYLSLMRANLDKLAAANGCR